MYNEIDYALVEEKRPPLYTAMKYWGKKPHNVWRTYIETYTDEIFLDPFSGSGMSAFEAVKAGKKAVAFDLNPLTSFVIDVCCSPFDAKEFKESVSRIYKIINDDINYRQYFSTICRECGKESIVQNYKWNDGNIYELGIVCKKCQGQKHIAPPLNSDIDKANESDSIIIRNWYPQDKFYCSPSFQNAFIKNIGGNSFSDLWTKRNLYIISEIFNEIQKEKSEIIKKQLMFGFIQTAHLCSKMCVPRNNEANRAFSTSWGRSAYICSKRQMEMNPLLLFYSNCIGKQSVESALNSVKKYIGKTPNAKFVKSKDDIDYNTSTDIFYGIIDINHLTDYISEKSIDFVITDPPYGGLVQYLDLSQIWLIWLKQYKSVYSKVDLSSEITIKKGIKDISSYKNSFTSGIKNLYKVLKDDSKIVFTFHNQDIKIWNAFLISIVESGFQIEKVIHQQNRRTGESNVANPYGTSGTDFYIRCVKSNIINPIKTSKEEFENFIVQRAISIITARNEPTPYQILFNGLLSEISKAGMDLDKFDDNIMELLSKHTNDIFIITENNDVSGNLWWLHNNINIKLNDLPLSDRVERTIENLLKSKRKLTFDEVLAEVFIKYPNGLTPDIKSIKYFLKKHAIEFGGYWNYKI